MMTNILQTNGTSSTNNIPFGIVPTPTVSNTGGVLRSCCGDYTVYTSTSTFIVGNYYIANDGTCWRAIDATVPVTKIVTLTFTPIVDCLANSGCNSCYFYTVDPPVGSSGSSTLFDYIDCQGNIHYNIDSITFTGACACAVFGGGFYGTKVIVTKHDCCGVSVIGCCSPYSTEVMNIPSGYTGSVMDISGNCYTQIGPTCDPATVEWIGFDAQQFCQQCINKQLPCPDCQISLWCLNTGDLLPYDGNYYFQGQYNGYDYYSGGTITPGFIFYDGTKWCLSDTLGGDCILFGNSNCNSNCPDLGNELIPGVCSSGTTTSPCDTFDFNVLFNCQLSPSSTPTTLTPTPTPTLTPTPTPTLTPTQICNVGIILSATTLATPTPTLTPSPTPTPTTKDCNYKGTVKFNLFNESFICSTSKKLVNCETGEIYYISGALLNDIGEPILTGNTISAIINGNGVCATYIENSMVSPNAVLSVITDVESDCNTCVFIPPTPTPTPTPTHTPTPSITPTITPTISLTPSITPTNTVTPTVTPTISETPTPTPTITPTPTTPPTFISVWRTSAPNDTITMPGTITGTIDWGDGNIVSGVFTTPSHSYINQDTYTVRISGLITDFTMFFTTNLNKLKLIEILTWGPLQISNLYPYSAFYRCSNLTLTGVTDTLDLSTVTILNSMFYQCSSLTTVNNMNSWDTSNITDMSFLFYGCPNFNQDISNWDTSNVTTMYTMFYGCNSFNQNIGGWNVSNVGSMQYMFLGATAFNQNIGGWNVSNVTNMGSMFAGATAFNQNIGSWNISGVTNFTNFMASKTAANYSTTNLDAIYNGWSSLPSVKPSITITFNTIKYTLASAAGKAILTGPPNNWSITDGGI